MRVAFSFILLVLTGQLWAEPILIGLHYNSEYLRASITITSGQFNVTSGSEELFEISKGQTADITASNGKVNVFFNGKNHTGISKITFKNVGGAQMNITPAGHKSNPRIYTHDLLAFAYSGRLQLVNKIEVEDYVCGVIEAESGADKELEYYKVQAVISRTYALNNKMRHAAEGFELCDATHCQVYHGKPRSEPLAIVATTTTKDIVIVDHDINLITAAFHSNCGGRTINAEDVWSKPVSYLVGRPDTFCLNMPHSNWEKSIPAEKWHHYIQSKKSGSETTSTEETLTLYQQERTMFCLDSCVWVPLRTMREDLKLKSTSFVVSKKESEVIFMGHGFGHAVGLCQEGAMRMAQLDYCYEDIIHFYYRDVHLIPRYMMWFFQED